MSEIGTFSNAVRRAAVVLTPIFSAVAVAALVGAAISTVPKPRPIILNDFASAKELVALRQEVADLRKQVVVGAAIGAALGGTGSASNSAEVASLSKRVEQLAGRQNRLERVLTAQPLRTLELPILRRDLDDQSQELAAMAAALQKAQDSQWETMRWLIGGLAASIAAICIPFIVRLLLWRSSSSSAGENGSV